MKRAPRPPKEPVINRDMQIGMVAVPIADTVAVLGAFFLSMQWFPGNLDASRTVAFATLVCSELLRAYTSRSEYYSVFAIGPFTNKWMSIATASSFVLLLIVMYVPFLQGVFGTYPLDLSAWLRIAPFFFVAPITAELVKLFLRRRAARRAAAA
jgi:Ca2+-transporting ATPase